MKAIRLICLGLCLLVLSGCVHRHGCLRHRHWRHHERGNCCVPADPGCEVAAPY